MLELLIDFLKIMNSNIIDNSYISYFMKLSQQIYHLIRFKIFLVKEVVNVRPLNPNFYSLGIFLVLY